jgi:hypothetical protein
VASQSNNRSANVDNLRKRLFLTTGVSIKNHRIKRWSRLLEPRYFDGVDQLGDTNRKRP